MQGERWLPQQPEAVHKHLLKLDVAMPLAQAQLCSWRLPFHTNPPLTSEHRSLAIACRLPQQHTAAGEVAPQVQEAQAGPQLPLITLPKLEAGAGARHPLPVGGMQIHLRTVQVRMAVGGSCGQAGSAARRQLH